MENTTATLTASHVFAPQCGGKGSQVIRTRMRNSTASSQRISAPLTLTTFPSSSVEAEEETIFCLRRECEALKKALRSLPKYSKEWTKLNSRFEIAKEELEAMLEDVNLTMSFSSGTSPSGCSEGWSCVHTPPLSSTHKTHKRHNSEFSTIKSGRELITESTALLFQHGAENGYKFNRFPKTNVQVLMDKLDRVDKYSLEYFQLKKVIKSASLREPSFQKDKSPISLDYSLETLQSTQAKIDQVNAYVPTNTERRRDRSMKLRNRQLNLNELLDFVPKYSLEWFQLNGEIKALSKKNRSASPTSTLSTQEMSLNSIRIRHQSSSSVSDCEDIPVSFPPPSTSPEHFIHPKSCECLFSQQSDHCESKSLKNVQDLLNVTDPLQLDDVHAHICFVCNHQKITILQSSWRRHCQSTKFKQLRFASILIQSITRKVQKQRLYRRILINATVIQKYWRNHIHLMWSASATIQSIVRMFLQHRQYLQMSKSWLACTEYTSEDDQMVAMEQKIEAMKNERMAMEIKVLLLKDDIQEAHDENLQRYLDCPAAS